MFVAVIGSAACDEDVAVAARQVGLELARRGIVLVCGGRGGVMEAACAGAKAGGGLTVGILPGRNRTEANRFVDIPIATGLGEARNAIVVGTSDAVIALSGGYGTLSEIGLALKMGKPVVGLGTWELKRGGRTAGLIPAAVSGLVAAQTPSEAVDLALRLADLGAEGGEDHA